MVFWASNITSHDLLLFLISCVCVLCLHLCLCACGCQCLWKLDKGVGCNWELPYDFELRSPGRAANAFHYWTISSSLLYKILETSLVSLLWILDEQRVRLSLSIKHVPASSLTVSFCLPRSWVHLAFPSEESGYLLACVVAVSAGFSFF